MTDGWSREDSDLAVSTVREMIEMLRPEWSVASVTRSEQGTDFVGIVDLEDTGDSEVPERAVLKATTADFVDQAIARSEPRFFEFLAARTDVPVPAVYGVCDEHESFPAPFYLVEYVPGETFESDIDWIDEDAIRRVLAAAGENLAALHELGPLDAVGDVGIDDDGELGVLDTDDHPSTTDQRAWLHESAMETLDALEDGGFFSEMADDPDRFADLVPEFRDVVAERVAALLELAPPTYCHWDYRWGNLIVDADTGETNAVLDWANLTAVEPAYNLATVESHMLDANDPDDATLRARRRAFRDAYERARTGHLDPESDDDPDTESDGDPDGSWTFTIEIRERMDTYRLLKRLDAMACLPLWHREKTPEGRDAVAAEHREFLEQYR
jgi:aminoglycoside phosphotransferase (APT) family kinase protein